VSDEVSQCSYRPRSGSGSNTIQSCFVAEVFALKEACGSLTEALIEWAAKRDESMDMDITAKLVKHPRAKELKKALFDEALRMRNVREKAA
jgi:hypothetical protein